MASLHKYRTVEEVLIIASSIIMAISITPFAVYRYMNQQPVAAMVEMLCVIMMIGVGIYVWKTRKTKLMALITSGFLCGGLVTLNYILGTSILFWIYPVIITVYFINSIKTSALLVTPTIIALIPLLIKEKTQIEIGSILITIFICQFFGFLVSGKIRHQYILLKEMVNQDSLTGSFNRRAFDERLSFLHSLALRHSKREVAIASLIMFDIDNFKAINDDFGHQEGDRILTNLAQLIKDNIRDTDQLYRYGGEEFAIIVNGDSALDATIVAEKIRRNLETSRISQRTYVTASFGVAELHRLESSTSWVKRADKALYRAKRAGKNRVFIANYDPTERVDANVLKLARNASSSPL